MTINPVNSGNNYVSQVQPQPQSQAERAAEKANEDAKRAAAKNVPVQPAVNTSGQKVGSVINVKA